MKYKNMTFREVVERVYNQVFDMDETKPLTVIEKMEQILKYAVMADNELEAKLEDELSAVATPIFNSMASSLIGQVTNLEINKADKSTTYTKVETNALLNDKQNVIADSGWLELSAHTGQAGTPMEGLPSFSEGNIRIRKINFGAFSILKYVGSVKIPNNADTNFETNDYRLVSIPSGYRINFDKSSPIIANANMSYLLSNSIIAIMVYSLGIRFRVNQTDFITAKNKWICIDETFIINN